MIFGREREAVRNATRAIRDLVLRPGREGSGGLGASLGAMAMLAAGPLRQLPQLATQVPGTLRDLGERMTAIPSARRRAPTLAFAAQALAGSVRYGATLRERYLNLLAASMDGETAARVHPAFLRPPEREPKPRDETAERAELGAASRSEVEQAIEDLRSVFDTFFLSQAGLEPE